MNKLLVCVLVIMLALPLLGVRAAAVVPPSIHQEGPPEIPANFWGTVRISGANVPDGCEIAAWVNGVKAAQRPVELDPQSGSIYVLNPAGDDPATPEIDGGTNGAEVTFVLYLPGGGAVPLLPKGVWISGSRTELNLSFTPALVLPLVQVHR
jgi:hypothetical protein